MTQGKRERGAILTTGESLRKPGDVVYGWHLTLAKKRGGPHRTTRTHTGDDWHSTRYAPIRLGETLWVDPEVKEIGMCRWGLHAMEHAGDCCRMVGSGFDPILWRVRLSGVIIVPDAVGWGGYKWCASERTTLAKYMFGQGEDFWSIPNITRKLAAAQKNWLAKKGKPKGKGWEVWSDEEFD